jgi:methyl-accepting chemotaxis protein
MKTSTRLALGFGLMIALLIVLTAISLAGFNTLGRSVDELGSSRVPKLIAGGKAIETLLQSARQMRNVLILDNETEIKSELADIHGNVQLTKDYLDVVERKLSGETEANLFKAISAARVEYAPHEAEFLKDAERGDYSTARDVMVQRLRGAQSKYIEAISNLIEYGAAESGAAARVSQTAHDRSRLGMTGFALLAILIGSAASILITRSLMARLGGEPAYAAKVAAAIAAGDLATEVAVAPGDDSSLLSNMKRMREDLAQAVGGIRISAESVSSASKEIASGNVELSSRTEEHASSLEQTSASMEELTATVKQNSENARQANLLAAGASDVASKGGKAMAEVVATMGSISQSSKKIMDIIGVIDSIAFQTNILALNAAVEAARAGEQGRGFAVVASEVRSLAQRSAAASKEVKDLIMKSVERIDGGTKLVEAAGATMEEIVLSAKRVTDIVSEIATSSLQQLAGIEQVGSAIVQMEHVVQQNAAVVEQTAAATENMAALAEDLNQAVARFTLDAESRRLALQASSEPGKLAAAVRGSPGGEESELAGGVVSPLRRVRGARDAPARLIGVEGAGKG